MLQKTRENRAPSIVEATPSSESSSVKIFESYLGFIRRQFPIVLFVFLLAIGLGTIYIVTTPPSYTASARMVIDTSRKGQFFQQQQIIADTPIDSIAVESQVEILKSENVALAVIKKLYLDEDAEFIGTSGGIIGALVEFVSGAFASNELASKFELTRRALGLYRNRLNVKRVGLTYVIEVSFRSVDAERAAQIANAVADAYIVDQLEAKYEATRRASTWLQDRIRELRDQASEAARAVVEYKAKNNIIDAGGKNMNDQRLGELNTQLVTARSHTSDTRARLDRIQQIINSEIPDATVTDSLKSEVVSKLRSQYLETAAREADWSARYGHNHLAAVDLRNRMRELRRAILDELRRIAETYKSDFEIAKQREESIREEMKQAVSVSQRTDEAAVTLRELESSAQSYRALYDNFLQRYMESIQQQSFPITEARVISRATKPLKKSHPQTLVVLALAGFGGVAVGFGLGMLRELSDRVFRTSSQVESTLETDCIAVVPLLKSEKESSDAKSDLGGEDSASRKDITRRDGVMWTVIDAPFSRFTEEIRSIKLAVDLKSGTDTNKIIGFTSSLPDEGKSSLATALAQLIATTGGRVVLIDCDLRNPTLSRKLAPSAEDGILEVIAGTVSLEEVLFENPSTGMMFLPAVIKSRLAHSNEVLASAATRKLFEQLRQRFDYVIVDLSPLAPVVDVRATTQLVDSYLFVIEWGRTKIQVVEQALGSAPAVYENLLGVVLNKANIGVLTRYEGYRGNYYYNKYYHRYGYTE